MSDGKVILGRDGPIAQITLDNQARRNALSRAMWDALDRVLDEIEGDPAIRVVIIRGAGGRAFSAGADISEFDLRHATPQAIVENGAREARISARLESLDQPVLAQIEGYCLGGAVAFALHCDLRICSDDSRFGIPPAKLGHCYDAPSLERVMRAVGLANTREILFTARQFSAAEAYEMGLVNRVVAKADLAAAVRDYALTMAANAPLTLKAVKRITAELAKAPERRDPALCEALVAACFASADHQEGRRAFLEKRAPVFRGR